jgi:G:T/U-mismatch repair DNA glycosylase
MDIEIHPYRDKTGLVSQLNIAHDKILNQNFQEGGIWFPDTKTIICGTFPPQKEYNNRKGYIHYSSPRNKLWQQIDKIHNTTLHLKGKIAKQDDLRIKNATEKIEFLKAHKIGLIDIYTKINRKVDSSKDSDIVPIETIFETSVFEKILSSNVDCVIFVYSLSKIEFETQLQQRFKVEFEVIKEHNDGGILLGIKTCRIRGKELKLIYYPMHGNNKDEKKLPALKKIFALSTGETQKHS